MPRKTTVDPAKGVLFIEWPLFGELARGLALKVARVYDPEIVVGIATAGVVPGAVMATMLGREFQTYHPGARGQRGSDSAVPGFAGPNGVASRIMGRRVLIVDETCDTGDTLRLAVAAIQAAGATEIRTAICIQTGTYTPDFHALATESTIVLPWDREIVLDGVLVPNPIYTESVAV